MRSLKFLASLCCAAGALSAAQAYGQQQPIILNDVLYGLSRAAPAETLFHLRGDPNNPVPPTGALKLTTAWDAASIQTVQFDNLDGFRHAWDGNALGMNFGATATGLTIHNLKTRNTPGAPNPAPSQALFDFATYNANNPGSPLTISRGAGLSVSPLNNRVAFTGVAGDAPITGRVFVMDYSAGPTPGTAGGATLTNGRELTGVVQSGSASNTTGTAWLDNDNFLTIQHPAIGAPDANATLKKVTISGATLTSTDVGTVAFAVAGAAFSSMAYEPTVSPYLYLTFSQFSGTTQNRLVVLDPNNSFASVGSFDYSTSMNTARENAFDAKGNLFISEFGNTSSVPLGGSIDRILKANVLANLANNNSAKYFTQDQSAALSAQFSGLDAAAAHMDYKSAGVTVNVRTKAFAVPYFPGTVDDPRVAIRSRLFTGRNGGTWDGTGSAILSTDAAAASPRNTAIGYVDSLDILPGGVGSWGNGNGTLNLVAGDRAVLMKYTYYGDTDLNGIVNFDDYSRTDGGFNTGGTTWFTGDFDYNAVVNFDDYALIDGAFNTQSGTLLRAMTYLDGSDRSQNGMNAPALQYVMEHFDKFGQPYANSFLNSIPEPASLSAFGLLAASALARRQRRA